MLEAGTRLGVYEIAAPIGTGGMGEVYRAVDTRLHRDVAVKICAGVFSGRFETEARTIAALNHPNICTLHDVGPNYLVMELIEGPTLAERIAEGPLPLDETLGIADQIQRALAAAHERGIVHRDLKPANIKIKPDGTVKVLDFGLARASEPLSGPVDLSPTQSIGATHAGVILGTAAYMSPEQARGKPVDKRADIWAFGVIMYEMVSGRRPFSGDTLTETIAAVIERDIDVTPVPQAVRPLLRACLQKDPRRRLQDIGDANLLMQAATTTDSRLSAESPRSSRLVWSAAAFLIGAAAAVGFIALRQPNTAAAAPTRFEIATPPLETGTAFYMAISPDARRVAFTAKGIDGVTRLWIRTMDALESREIAGTDGAVSLFWSPDSRFVGFGQQNRLRRVAASGDSPPVTLTEIQTQVGMGAWSGDVIVFASRVTGAGIWRVAAGGGSPQPVTKPRKDQVAHTFPIFLPDGRHFLYLARAASPDVVGIYGASIDAAPDQQPSTRIVATSLGAAYVSRNGRDGEQLLFVRDGTLLMQPFDSERLEVSGNPVPILERVGAAGSSGFFAASPTALAYRQAPLNRQLAWFDRSGTVLDSGRDRRNAYTGVALSGDGRRVATAIADTRNGVWLIDFTPYGRQPLAFEAPIQRSPVWSPDDRTVAVTASASINGPFTLYRVSADGAGIPEALFKADDDWNSVSPLDWSSDGNFLLVAANAKRSDSDVWLLALQGERELAPLLATTANEGPARFSPDGHWIVYRSDEGGSGEIYVRPFTPNAQPMLGSRMPVSNGGGAQPRWRRDGKEILYISNDNRLMSVDVTGSGSTIELGSPKPLFSIAPAGATLGGPGSTWDMTRDAQRFLISIVPTDSPASPITILENWRTTVTARDRAAR